MNDQEKMADTEETAVGERTIPLPPTKPEKPTRYRGGGVTGPILLIAIGALFLLNNMGVVEVDWFSLWRFWPVLLILVGLDVIFGRRGVLGSIALAIVALMVVGGIAFFATARTWTTTGTSHGTIAEPLGDIDRLEVTIDMGAVDANIEALAGGDDAVRGEYTTHKNLAIAATYSEAGGSGILAIEQKEFGRGFPGGGGGGFASEINLGLTGEVPIDLTINVGAGDLTLDLEGLDIRSLKIEAGAGSVEVTLPDKGQIDVDVDLGMGNVSIDVPDSMEVLAQFDVALTNLDISHRLVKGEEDIWRTSGYSASAENRVQIQVGTAVGNVTVR
jgi:hypothetical protein